MCTNPSLAQALALPPTPSPPRNLEATQHFFGTEGLAILRWFQAPQQTGNSSLGGGRGSASQHLFPKQQLPAIFPPLDPPEVDPAGLDFLYPKC